MAAQAATISLSHHEPLQRLSIKSAGIDGSQKIGAIGPVDMRFDALGRSFDLQLTPNNRLLDASRDLTGGTAIPYRGKLAGNDDSWVRIVIADGTPSGLIWDGSELFAIERPGDNLAGSDSTIIFRLEDALVAPESMACGAGDKLTTGGTVYKSLVAELNAASARAAGAVSWIDIGIVADAEFYARHGDNAGQAITDRMSFVDGYFSEQVGIQIEWPFVQVFKDSSATGYPFTATVSVDSNEPNNLLTQLTVYRSGDPNRYENGLTHLWTGKDVEGANNNTSTVGIAYTSELCDRQFGVGLSEGRLDAAFDSLIAAHEIGHNFGAPHDGAAGSACESETGRFLMAPSLNGSDQFSQCSLNQMADDIANAACIKPLPSWDMGLSPAVPAPTVLLGNSATITFDVVNVGTEEATNVVADFTLPANVSLFSAAASLGSCSDGGGIVSCAIGNVQGTTTITVTLTSATVAVGSGTFNASVTAEFDDNPTNNESSLLLTVQPAVNLSVTPPSARQVDEDQSMALTALIENTSILDATDVTLSIALSPGLRADSASWPLGSCTVSSSQVECLGATLGSQSNTTLGLGVTALTNGTKTIDISVSSLEADANPGDNVASATVNVGTPPQEESGGGSAGLWLLSLLGLVAIRRRALFP